MARQPFGYRTRTWPNPATILDTNLQNLTELELDLSMLLKVKPNDAVGTPGI